MSEFDSLSPAELTFLASIVAIIIAKDRTTDDVSNLANFVAAVGGNLSLIASQQETLQEVEDKLAQISDLKKQIKEIKKDL